MSFAPRLKKKKEKTGSGFEVNYSQQSLQMRVSSGPPAPASERHFGSGAAAGRLPPVRSLLSVCITASKKKKNSHKSLGFIKMNGRPLETHLLTYSSSAALALNSTLPVSRLACSSRSCNHVHHCCVFFVSRLIHYPLIWMFTSICDITSCP